MTLNPQRPPMVGSMPSSEAEACALIVRAVLQLARRLRAERPVGSATLAQLAVLATLHRSGPMPAARLAEHERLRPQSLTRIIAQMLQLDLIERRRGDGDRRILVIEITPRGRKLLARDIGARRAWLERAMKHALNPAERNTLRLSAALMLKVAVCAVADP